MNDTHPTVAVAELMRILLDEEGMSWDEAWEITTHCVAYTNHTIMAEALEKWPIDIFQRLLPRVYQIVDEINRRFVEEIRAKYPDNEEKVRKMAILYDGQVKMANLAIVAGYSVNGVARLIQRFLRSRNFVISMNCFRRNLTIKPTVSHRDVSLHMEIHCLQTG